LSSLIKDIISRVMNERFTDIEAKPDTPFISADMEVGNMCETMEVTYASVSSNNGEAIPAFKAFMTEAEKMKKFGFTDAEIDRAKKDIISTYETRAKRAATRTNSQLVPELINNFFDNYSYMEPEKEYELVKQLCGFIDSKVINKVLPSVVTDTNMVVIYEAPEKEGLSHPSKEDFLNAIHEVDNADIKPNAEEVVDKPLLDAAKLKGSTIKKTSGTVYGATEWTLKNGVKVIAMKSDKEKDRIRIKLFKNGGKSLIDDKDLPSFDENIFGLFLRNSGISEFPNTTLSKMLSGKNLYMSPFIDSRQHGISGSSTKKDLETAFQLMYLYFTHPRFDQNEFDQGMNQLKAVLPNLTNQPNYRLQDQLYKTLYNDSPRHQLINDSIMQNANLQTIERVYKDLFKDAAGTTVLIVGDFGTDTLKTYVEKYIGSLPKGKKSSKWIDRNDDMVSGKIENIFSVDMQTPQSTVCQIYNMPYAYSVKNQVIMDAIQYILDMIYTDTLREDEGGTYGASTQVSLSKYPKEKAMVLVAFNTKPSSADKLRALAVSGMKNLAENGPTDEQFSKTIENFKKQIPEKRVDNDYWLSQLFHYCVYGENEDQLYEKAVNELKPEDIKDMLQKIIGSGNYIEIVMNPGKSAEKE
jgi:zinc protease